MWNKYCKRIRPQKVEWKGGSHIWKHMLQARDFFDQKIWWETRIGHTSLWYDNWIQLGALHSYLPISYEINEAYEEVQQIRNEEGWDYNLMEELFPTEVCNQIHNVFGRLQKSEERDKAWWMPKSSGKFTVGSAWELSRQRKGKQEGIMNIWE